MHEECLFQTAETVSRQGRATLSTCQMRAFGYFPFSWNQFWLLSISRKAISATFHFPESIFGYFPFPWNQFQVLSATHETISGKTHFQEDAAETHFLCVKSDYAPCYAVCWSKLRSPQNRERTVNTGFPHHLCGWHQVLFWSGWRRFLYNPRSKQELSTLL